MTSTEGLTLTSTCAVLEVHIFVAGPANGMREHDFCLLFQAFMTHNFLYHYTMAMQCSALSKYLIGFIVQVIELCMGKIKGKSIL